MDIYPKTYGELIFYCKKILKKILPSGLLNLYFSFFPFVGDIIFRHPSRKIKIIGVTGTDGKSSTVVFISRILKSAGYKVGFFSSVLFNDGVEEKKNQFKMTMPGRFFMQKFLTSLVKNKCDFAVLEVTSEGVKQKRHLFIDFDIAVCTNIKPEHIESHGGFTQYKWAKSRLFENLKYGFRKQIGKTIVVNGDDAEAKTFLVYDADKKITFGFSDQNSIHGKVLKSSILENVIRITGKEDAVIKLKNGGPFVLENILAAVAVAYSLGIDVPISKRALENNSSISGRFEVISKNPCVIIDYAHTVAAVEKILAFVRKEWNGEIVHIFGAAGGGRDKWKRPKFAELSEKFTDFSILTEENSFDEPIENILGDILNGFKNKDRVKVIPKRKEAVADAIQRSNSATLLLFTGKGSETVIAGLLGRKAPYNEKETIWQLLKSPHK